MYTLMQDANRNRVWGTCKLCTTTVLEIKNCFTIKILLKIKKGKCQQSYNSCVHTTAMKKTLLTEEFLL